MSIKLNKEAYQKLINEDIEMLVKHMPEHSLEKKHIIDVLNWSVNQLYSSCHIRDYPEEEFGVIKCQRWKDNPRGCLNCNESYVKRNLEDDANTGS